MIFEVGVKNRKPMLIEADVMEVDMRGALVLKRDVLIPTENNRKKREIIYMFNTNKWDYVIKDPTRNKELEK